jgi:hypothetical protein
LTHDPDQEDVYQWVRSATARYQIYIPRYLRADDLADPGDWASILARIDEIGSSGRKTPQQASRLERIAHHQKLLSDGQGTDADWSAIIDDVDELIGDGIRPSSRELRDLIMPLVDIMPDRNNLPRNFHQVLREIDRFLATRSPVAGPQIPHEPTVEVKKAADLLRGKSIVLIGGDRRRETQEALKKAFQLESVIWIETKEHQSIETFAPLVARPGVVLVMLAIRWSSHSFGDVRQFCEHHGKPLVRLPGGYSPNQVAAQILMQCSEQLGG